MPGVERRDDGDIDVTRIEPVSGTQLSLHGGGYSAAIACVGATVRELNKAGRAVVAPFAADVIRPAMRGALLLPWPNRTVGAQYEFDGDLHTLPVNDHEFGAAAHGLVSWQRFEALEVTSDRAILGTTVEPQPGYPWRLKVEVTFVLGENGLSQEVVVTNESSGRAPCGIGGHPYLSASQPTEQAVQDWLLQVPAAEVLGFTGDRLLPADLEHVEVYAAGSLDFRRGRRIGDTVVNHAFTALDRDTDGRACVRVSDSDGSATEISFDARCPWVHIYTADGGIGKDCRHAVAVEPMTCPPNAFNSKQDLRILEPGQSMSAGWRIRSCHSTHRSMT